MKSAGGGKISNYNELRERLAFYADDEFRDFTAKIIPTKRPIFGVKIPQVRELAGLVPRECYDEMLAAEPVALEEVVFRGFLIAKLSYEKMLELFDSQVKYIDDWCSCDTFCAAIRKTVEKHKEEFLDLKVEGLLQAQEEYTVRVGLVMLKVAYVKLDFLALIFDRVEKLGNREEYYIKMAIAWLLSECFIKYPEETLKYLETSQLPAWTFNKTISKICDSYRVKPEMKTSIKKLRR